MKRIYTSFTLLLILTLGLSTGAQAQKPTAAAPNAVGTAFTYQGQLKGASGLVTGNCDFHFSLWNALSSGMQVGVTLEQPNIAVSEGLFVAQLDFGVNAFDGNARWLEIAVRCPAGSGDYTALAPRQPLSPAPYATYAVSAGTAANLSGVLPVANGGTGSNTQNFVDLSTAQTVGGAKTFSSAPTFNASGTPFNVSGNGLVANLNADLLDGQQGSYYWNANNDGAGSTLDADLLDGQHASAFQQRYQNLVVVAKSGGDFTTITDALNSITTASASNPFTVYVAPGVYTEMVTMKPYVDIEGASETATRITHAGWVSSTLGTVMGANNAELRFLAVENTGGADFAIAIYNDHASTRITHVIASAFSGTINSIGVDNEFADPTLTDVTASGSGATFNVGVYNYYSSAIMTNVAAAASSNGGTSLNYGVSNQKGSPKMNHVTASASGGATNYGVANSDASPTMNNVTATASGGESSYGVYNDYNSCPIMRDTTAVGSEGVSNYGVRNEMASSPTMINVTATASGRTESSNYGVWNASSSVTIQNSVISASGGSINDGIHNDATSGSYVVQIKNSQITGNTSTIYQTSQYTTQVGASQIAGAGAFGSTYTCAASYDENYIELNSSCQP